MVSGDHCSESWSFSTTLPRHLTTTTSGQYPDHTWHGQLSFLGKLHHPGFFCRNIARERGRESEPPLAQPHSPKPPPSGSSCFEVCHHHTHVPNPSVVKQGEQKFWNTETYMKLKVTSSSIFPTTKLLSSAMETQLVLFCDVLIERLDNLDLCTYLFL